MRYAWPVNSITVDYQIFHALIHECRQVPSSREKYLPKMKPPPGKMQDPCNDRGIDFPFGGGVHRLVDIWPASLEKVAPPHPTAKKTSLGRSG